MFESLFFLKIKEKRNICLYRCADLKDLKMWFKHQLYSMIVLNCYKRWVHTTKSRRARYNLKKHLEDMILQIFDEKSRGLFSFDLLNAYELKGRFCQRRLFIYICNCFFVNCSHFWTVWATEPRLVSYRRYFDVVLGEKPRQRYFQRLIPPNMNDFVVSGKNCLQNWQSVNQMHSKLRKSLSVELFPKSTWNSFHMGPIWHL